MGRLMPLECEHGNVIDWGDFGPDDDTTPCCSQCDVLNSRLRVRFARWLLRRVR